MYSISLEMGWESTMNGTGDVSGGTSNGRIGVEPLLFTNFRLP